MRSAPTIRAIVLDFNGTLAQDDHLVAPLYVDMFASVGLSLTVEDYHREFARDVRPRGRRARAPASRAAGRSGASGRARQGPSSRGTWPQSPTSLRSPSTRSNSSAPPLSASPLAITSGAFRREIEHVLSCNGCAGLLHDGRGDRRCDERQARSRGIRARAWPAERPHRRRPADRASGKRSPSKTRPAARRPRGPRRCGWRRSADWATSRPAGTRTWSIERLDRASLERMLALGSEGRGLMNPELELICDQVPELASPGRRLHRSRAG